MSSPASFLWLLGTTLVVRSWGFITFILNIKTEFTFYYLILFSQSLIKYIFFLPFLPTCYNQLVMSSYHLVVAA